MSPPPRTQAVLFALLWFVFSYAHQGLRNETSLSRLDALQALWNHGTLAIDAYQRNTPDKALFYEHYYSDKAPGVLAVAVPGFVISAWLLERAGVAVDSPNGWLVTGWAATATSVALICAAGGVALFVWLRRRVSEGTAWGAALALFLGSAPLHYSSVLLSQAMVVGLLCLALWALDEENEDKPSTVRFVFGGACLGLALASEYSAGLMVVGLLLWVVRHHWRRVGWLALGMIPPLLLIPAYSWMCFGTPFTIGYAHHATFNHHQFGFYGVAWPDGAVVWRWLFDSGRGLFVWSPVLLVALAGYSEVMARWPRWFWPAYLLPVIQIVVMSGYSTDWQAGIGYGPRLIAPMLPWLALPLACAWERWPVVMRILAVISCALTGMATWLDTLHLSRHDNPWREGIIPAFFAGNYAPNLGNLFGLTGHWSLLPLLAFVVACFAWRRRKIQMSANATTSIH